LLVFLISLIHVTFPAYFTLLESNILVISGYVWGTKEMHKGFCWKTLWKEVIWKTRRRWEDNTKIYL
jgi:hypothetical protein